MAVLRSKTSRWAVPLGVAAVIGAGAAVAPLLAGADPSLPSRTPEQLLVAVEQAKAQPFSGTVVETVDLGLPKLPTPPGGGDTSLSSLASGSHTARVWYASPDKARFALLGSLAETDVIRNGRDAWVWQSSTNTATHYTLTEKAAATPAPMPTSTLTPQEAAQQALAAVDPTTAVRVAGTDSVAGRNAYELVLEPKQSGTLIGSVRIAVDEHTSLPLRVQVFPKAATKPAVEVGFTSVSFDTPADSVFSFTPPPGAKVQQHAGHTTSGELPKASTEAVKPSSEGPKVIGAGWTAVVSAEGIKLAELTKTGEQGQVVLKALTPVSGTFGTGRSLTTKLFSVLLLDDGRAFVGAVPVSALEQAAAQ